MRVRLPTAALLLFAVAQPAHGDGKATPAPLVFRGTLDPKDPTDRVQKKSPHRVHTAQLETGKAYLLELRSKDFDAFLRVEDGEGKPLAQDDDSGGGTDARLLFGPPKGGVYRLIVTAFPRGQPRGAYVLSVRALTPREQLAEKAQTLNGEGIQRYKQGDLVAAARLLREAVALGRQVYPLAQYPDGHPSLATGLSNLAIVLKGQRQLDEARACFQEAITIQTKVLPPNNPTLAHNLSHLGILLSSQGQVQQARAYFEKALAIYQKALPPDHRDQAASRSNLASVLRELGELGKARALLEQALNIGRKARPPDATRLAATLSSLAGVFEAQGKLAEARAHQEEALAIRKKVLPPDHVDLGHNLNDLGTVLREQGLLEEARVHFAQALAIHKKAWPPNHSNLAACLNNLGWVLQEQGKLDEARAHHEQALAMCRQALPADPPQLALILNGLGGVLDRQGKAAEARTHYEQARDLCRKALPPTHATLTTVLSNLGMLLAGQGHLKEARVYLEEVLAIRRKVLRPDHPHLAIALNNLGRLLEQQGELEEARLQFGQGVAIFEKVLPPDHPSLAMSRNNLAVVLQQQGKLEEARALYERALASLKRTLPREHPDLAQLLTNLGTVLHRLKRTDEGWPLLVAAAETSARHAALFAAGAAQADHGGGLLDMPLGYVDVLLTVAAGAPELPAPRRLDLLARLLDSRALSATALRRRGGLLAHADVDSRALADKLLARRRRLADLLLQGPGRGSPEQHRQDSVALQTEADGLERALAQRLKPFADLTRARQATPAEVAARLPPQTVLIELVRYSPALFEVRRTEHQWGPPQYAALLLWSERAGAAGVQVRLVSLGAAAPLERAVAAWRGAQQAGRVDAESEGRLRRLVWAPLARALPGRTRRLVIAPDGALALLPFEALRLQDGQYLIERYAVQYVATGRDLMPGPEFKERSNTAVVLADPDYDSQGQASPGREPPEQSALRAGDASLKGLRFQRLPGFAREADAVATLLRNAANWRVVSARRGEASEETLRRLAPPRLLCSITHGFFLKDVERLPRQVGMRDLQLASAGPGRPRLPHFGQDPRLRSGLALAGANRWQERSAKGLSDGLLTALEVENLDLWGTELVVLSACETGLGEVQVGEGVLGLRRAFQLAGAQTVVASLWKVPDAETQQLMTDFLGRWLKGEGKADALRNAQLGMIQRLRAGASATRREAPPLYWAGFICHGQGK